MNTTFSRPYEIQHLPNEKLQVLFLDNNDSVMLESEITQAHEFIDEYLERIDKQFPWHIIAVEKMLADHDKSIIQLKQFPRKYRFKIAEQSMKCLFGNIDPIPDRDENGRFNVEKVACPMRSRCKWNGYSERNKHLKCVVCNPVMGNNLTDAEIEVAKLLASPYTTEQIAVLRSASPNTIRVQRRNIFKKLGVHTRLQLTDLIKTQRLK